MLGASESSYGGIYERGSREYTLDDFHTLQLDKLDRYVCLKESTVLIPPEGEDVSSSDDDDDDDDDDESGDDDTSSSRESEGEGESVVATTSKTKRKKKEVVKAAIEEDEKKESPEPLEEVVEARKKEDEEIEPENAPKPEVEAFMGVAKDVVRSPEEMLSTPLPGETLAAFYARSREYTACSSFFMSRLRY